MSYRIPIISSQKTKTPSHPVYPYGFHKHDGYDIRSAEEYEKYNDRKPEPKK